MRFTKYIAIALAIVATLLAAGWFLRNTIIEQISNPLLAEYGLAITDVSLDAMATSDASISYLELEHADGTVIAIYKLTLPIGRSPTGFKTYTAEKLTIDLPADGGEEPLDLARVLGHLLSLPLQLPQIEIVIAEVSAPPYPVTRDLRWRFSEDSQQVIALVDSVLLTAEVDRVSDTEHSLNVSIADSLVTSAAQSITVDLQRTEDGISLEGSATLDLARWTPVSTLLGLEMVDVESGTAILRFNSAVADDSATGPTIYADLTPTTPVTLSYRRTAHAITSLTVKSASTIEVTATYPDMRWSLRQAQASLLVSDGEFRDIPVTFNNLSCQSGTTCSADVSIVMENAVMPLADIARLEVAATQEVAISDEGLQVHVQPNATVSLSGISGPETELARFDALLTSTAELTNGDSGWRFTAQSADVTIGEYSVTGDIGFSAQVFLDDLSFSDESNQLFMKIGAYASSSQVKMGAQRIRLPGFKGGIALQGEEIAVFLETVGLLEEASIEASLNLGNESGRIALRNGTLSFGKQGLASRITPWTNDWNISAGTLGFDARAEWRKQGNEWQVTAQTSILLADLAGVWSDTAFAGLTTNIDATFDTAKGVSIQPATIEVALVELGLPIENITANYTLRADEQSVDIGNLRMIALGGVITADPFSFSTANERNTLRLRASSIDLVEILSIQDFESIEISGSIGAELPVTIEGNTVSIDGGRLSGEAPGGVIRYLPGIGRDPMDTSGLGFATRALSNFEFETLTSEVDYDPDGNLKLQMRLTGRNPDLDSKRPVILNLGLENNIPEMLRSLQAARSVEDVLQKRLAK